MTISNAAAASLAGKAPPARLAEVATLAAAALFLLGVALAGIQLVAERRTRSVLAEQNNRISGAERLLSALKDVETGERGFVLTGRRGVPRAVPWPASRRPRPASWRRLSGSGRSGGGPTAGAGRRRSRRSPSPVGRDSRRDPGRCGRARDAGASGRRQGRPWTAVRARVARDPGDRARDRVATGCDRAEAPLARTWMLRPGRNGRDGARLRRHRAAWLAAAAAGPSGTAAVAAGRGAGQRPDRPGFPRRRHAAAPRQPRPVGDERAGAGRRCRAQPVGRDAGHPGRRWSRGCAR